MELKDRLRLVMEKLNLQAGTFAESVGASQSSISHYFSGKRNPSYGFLMKVHSRYPHISMEWLLNGTGEMMNDKARISGTPTQVGNTTVVSSSSMVGKPPYTPSLFDENPEIPINRPVETQIRKEMPSEPPQNTHKETVIQEIKYIEKPARKITEIRIFFDDNTFEIFKPEVK